MASGQVNRANKGRTHGRTDQCCIREENPCQHGAVHTWPIAPDRGLQFFGHCSAVGSTTDIEYPPPGTQTDDFRVWHIPELGQYLTFSAGCAE
jgi:hypothetical protein